MPSGAWASSEWRFAHGHRVIIDPTFICNTNEAAIATAVTGWGLTRVLFYQIGPSMLDGTLKIVLGEFEEPPLPIHVLYPEGRKSPAKVRRFVDMVVAQLRENPMLN